MDVSENSGTPKSSILIGFSIIFTIHFGVPLFLETPVYIQMRQFCGMGTFTFGLRISGSAIGPSNGRWINLFFLPGGVFAVGLQK